jgi:hypothetical protein
VVPPCFQKQERLMSNIPGVNRFDHSVHG